MRRQLSFLCEGAACAATLDEGNQSTGLLIVSGGNEIRSGAHRGMAWLANELATAGYPVLRYDRRGIGDSEGDNGGFRSSGPDITAAADLFRAEAGVQRIVAFGNCDAATALAMFGTTAGVDALLLANPWTFDDDHGDAEGPPALPPASAIRARYLARLKDPRQLWRLVSGGVDYRKLWGGLSAARGGETISTGLAAELIDAMVALTIPAKILLAARDRTAMAFAQAWTKAPADIHATMPVSRIDSASHGFASDQDRSWLVRQLMEQLRL